MAGWRCLVGQSAADGRRMTDGRWRQVSSWMQEFGGAGRPGQGREPARELEMAGFLGT